MLIAGFSQKGYAVRDIPGVRFKVVILVRALVCLCWHFLRRRKRNLGLDIAFCLGFILISNYAGLVFYHLKN